MVLALENPVPDDAVPSVQSGSASGLTAFIARQLGRNDAQLLSCVRLEGGAVQENWRIVVGLGKSAGFKTERYVLRTSAKTHLPDSRPKAEEFAILCAAWDAGVLVPEPLWLCEDHSVIGADFFLSREIPGSAQGQSIMALNRPDDGNPGLVQELGRQLAKIHNIKSLSADLAFLGQPGDNPAQRDVQHWREELDALEGSWPALEWGLRWCENHLPATPVAQSLLHGDFRTGNYLVETDQNPRGRLSAILDWEFAQWGDPMSDIGWFCAACWRFGRPDLEAGGIGTRAAFYQAYEETSGQKIDPKIVTFWEVIAHIRWTIIACQQGSRFFDGGEDSLDLALTGLLRPAQVQRHLLEITAPKYWKKGREQMAELETNSPKANSAEERRGLCETTQVLASAADLFRDEIEPTLPESQRVNGRMLADALACVLRDLGSLSDSTRPDNTRSTPVGQDQAIGLHLALLEKISKELGPVAVQKTHHTS